MTKDREFYRTLIRLSLPISLQNFITFGVAFTDNLMVGRLGDFVISGVYMGNQVQTLLQFYMAGIDGALLILAAQYWGRRDTESIKKLVAMASRFALIGGAVLSAAVMMWPAETLFLFTDDARVVKEGLDYIRIVCFSYMFFCVSQVLISVMRSVETVKIGLYISILTLLSNIVLNYVFIFGKLGLPEMGAAGAALATLICRIAEFATITFYVLSKDGKLKLKLSDFLLRDKRLLRDYIRYGFPVLAGQIVWSVNVLSQGAIIGRMSAEAIVAVSVTGMLSNLFFVWVLGLGAGVGIIIGKTVGANQTDRVKEYSKTVQVIFVVIGFIGGIFVFLLRDGFLSLYNLSDSTLTVVRQFINVLAVAMVGRCYQGVCLAGLVKAGGDTGFVFRNDTIFVFLVVLPSALIAMNIFHAPAWVVYACLQSDQILKCPVAFVKINRYKWIKNLTRENAG